MRTSVKDAPQALTGVQARFIEDNVGLLYKLGQKYAKLYEKVVDEDDGRQIAAMGFLRAVQTFDASRGATFGVYAAICIRSELSRYCAGEFRQKRDRRRNAYNVDLDYIVCSEEDTEGEAIRRIEAEEARRAVEHLFRRFPKNRAVMELIMSGCSPSEAAKKLGVSRQAVHGRLKRMAERAGHLAAQWEGLA